MTNLKQISRFGLYAAFTLLPFMSLAGGSVGGGGGGMWCIHNGVEKTELLEFWEARHAIGPFNTRNGFKGQINIPESDEMTPLKLKCFAPLIKSLEPIMFSVQKYAEPIFTL